MKIVHVVDSMELGGAETLVSQICRTQREEGHEPSICAIAALGVLGQRMRADGFTVQSNVGSHFSDSVRSFFRIFKESQPDVVHLHNPTPTIYAAMAARLAGVSSVISTRHSLVAPPHRLAEELKYAIAARFCDWIVGICDATTNNIKSLHTIPARKIIRVYNGTNPLTRNGPVDWPTKLGFTLIYVGRLEPIKNHALLVRAFHSALRSRPDMRLWMVGDGKERESIEHLVKELNIDEEITFWGQQLDVGPFFSAADAFIMSSKSEGLPMSLLQAMSLGLPAIVTDVGGMAEVVRIAAAGITVPANNETEMAAAILRLAGNEAERKHFSQCAAQGFQQRFSLHTMADAYMTLYRSTPRAQRNVC